MNLALLVDVIVATCFLLASFFALVAAIGMVRFPDLLSRMHAGTKPQVVGLGLALIGLAIELGSIPAAVLLLIVATFQGVTAPIASHMVGRASFRAGQVQRELLITDELTETLDVEEPRGAP